MDPEKVTLKDVMTRELIKVSPDDTAGRCLELMKDHRCRHLLVFKEGYFIGIISLRDIVALMIEEKEAMIEQLQTYITS
jgi:predicted transcriptional regulator